jgi:hypothetical protein
MGLQQMVLSAGGGGAVEYDSLADLPAPSVGALAIVGGLLLEASGGVWVYQVSPSPMASATLTAPGNVANAIAGLEVADIAAGDDLGAPSSTSAWTTVP